MTGEKLSGRAKSLLAYGMGALAIVLTFTFLLVIVVDGFAALHENNQKVRVLNATCVEHGFRGWDSNKQGCWS